MSEGEFVNMRPHIEGKRGTQIDESSDTYDTIDWLVKNIPPQQTAASVCMAYRILAFKLRQARLIRHPGPGSRNRLKRRLRTGSSTTFIAMARFVLPMGFGFFSSFGQPRLNRLRLVRKVST